MTEKQNLNGSGTNDNRLTIDTDGQLKTPWRDRNVMPRINYNINNQMASRCKENLENNLFGYHMLRNGLKTGESSKGNREDEQKNQLGGNREEEQR